MTCNQALLREYVQSLHGFSGFRLVDTTDDAVSRFRVGYDLRAHGSALLYHHRCGYWETVQTNGEVVVEDCCSKAPVEK